MTQKNILIIIIVAIVVIGGVGYFARQASMGKPPVNNVVDTNKVEKKTGFDPKNATYSFDGQDVTLVNGRSEKEVAQGSQSKTITQYFGNEVRADFNRDKTEDVAFIMTQNSGGSGTFYYVAAVISLGEVHTGTNVILLGDRIAPQTTEFKNGMIIVNYAQRKEGESFTTPPSVGVSKYFKIIDANLVEIDLKMTETDAKTIAEKTCIKGGEALGEGSYNENSNTWWFDANLNATKEGCNPACVVDAKTKTAEINWRCTGAIIPK